MTEHEDITRRRENLSGAQRTKLEARLAGALHALDQPTEGIPDERGELLPLSFAEEQLWLLYRLYPEGTAYNSAHAYRLQGPLDVGVLERCLTEITRRHEIMRSHMKVVGDEVFHVIAPSLEMRLPVHDLSHLPEEEREAAMHRCIREDGCLTFDLERGPLFRAKLFGLRTEEHVLLMTTHHIVSDGWSSSILLKETLELYEAFIAGKESPLPELPHQYADFAIRQRKALTETALAPHLAYFVEEMKGAPPLLALPYDTPRSEVQTFRGAQESVLLPDGLEESLRALAHEEGATTFMTVFAALHILLHRYSNQEDIVVGFPVSGRNASQSAGLLGIFINTLVLRCDLSENPSFRALLRQVRGKALGAIEHQALPFAQLVQALRPGRTAGQSPVFQVLFNWKVFSLNKTTSADLTVTEVDLDPGFAQFDLTVEFSRVAAGLRCALVYNTDVFEAGTIQRMLANFITLLEGIAADSGRCVSALPLLTAGERQQILYDWNDTAVTYPEKGGFHCLFEEQVERTPDATAVVFGEERVTYSELNARANQMAHYLRARDLGDEALVAIYLERSVEMLVSLLGTLKAGLAYVPLDTAYPAERIRMVLEDIHAGAVLTQRKFVDSLPSGTAHVVCVDQAPESLAGMATTNPPWEVTADSLAYVIYTSGSTGRPKGVAIAHRSVCNLLISTRDIFDDAEISGVLGSASFAFDASIFDFFVALSYGGKIILVENILSLSSIPAREEVTMIDTVPSALVELLRQGALPDSLVAVSCGGEFLPGSLVDSICALGYKHVFDFYGPTEATVHAIRTLRRKGEPAMIGRPIPNAQAYILDPHRQPVPIGVVGELYLGGLCLARGYLNRPALTAEKFIVHPFSEAPGERLYQTGDLCRYLPDGNIVYVGRIDHQVKLRGYRIELGEIESVLVQHPDIRESVVELRVGDDGNKRLAGYVVSSTPTLSGRDIKAFLREHLPTYMVPSDIVFLEKIPLTSNGKVDRKSLPEPVREEGRGGVLEERDEPRTKIEKDLHLLWRRHLQVEDFGIRENFFDLGGHSLLAVQMVATIQETLQLSVTVRDIFEKPTVEGLAARFSPEADRDVEVGAESLPAGALDTAPDPCVEMLRPGTTNPPFFCATGAGSVAGHYSALASHLSEAQPFWGLKDPSLEQHGESYPSVSALARRYIQAVKKVEPHGPYHLGGWSYGGIVAFEMAQQMSRDGDEIAALILLDTHAPGGNSKVRPSLSAKTSWFWKRVLGKVDVFYRTWPLVCGYLRDSVRIAFRNMMGQRSPAEGSVSARKYFAWAWHDLHLQAAWKKAGLKTARFSDERLKLIEDPFVQHAFETMKSKLTASREYTCTQYAGLITLITSNADVDGVEASLGWEEFSGGGIEIHEISGCHATLLRGPYAAETAAVLQACLDSARE